MTEQVGGVGDRCARCNRSLHGKRLHAKDGKRYGGRCVYLIGVPVGKPPS